MNYCFVVTLLFDTVVQGSVCVCVCQPKKCGCEFRVFISVWSMVVRVWVYVFAVFLGDPESRVWVFVPHGADFSFVREELSLGFRLACVKSFRCGCKVGVWGCVCMKMRPEV